MLTLTKRGTLGTLLAVLALLAACSDTNRPTAPTAPPPERPPVFSPDPTAPLPPISGPARVFANASSSSVSIGAMTAASRFVLYDDGTFALQFPGPLEYRGIYRETDGLIVFDWEGLTAGAWGADATLEGRTLTVRYDLAMQLSDFENAAYHLVD